MNNISMLISDPYDRKARLKPALLALLPVIFLCISLFPEIQSIWSYYGRTGVILRRHNVAASRLVEIEEKLGTIAFSNMGW